MKKLILTLFIIVLLGFGGWYFKTEIHTTPIGTILKSPRNYSEREVAIAGTVTERFSLFVVKYFILRDSTGNIIVVTDRALPAIGANVRVKGRLEEGFSFGDQQMLVFLEKPATKN